MVEVLEELVSQTLRVLRGLAKGFNKLRPFSLASLIRAKDRVETAQILSAFLADFSCLYGLLW